MSEETKIRLALAVILLGAYVAGIVVIQRGNWVFAVLGGVFIVTVALWGKTGNVLARIAKIRIRFR